MIGQTVSHYRILEKLGEGGMGVVYKAEDTRLRRNVALKLLPSGASSSDQERSRFLQEARAAAALDHPNICPIYEIADEDAEPFIAMGYVEGRSLHDIVASGPIPLPLVLDLSLQISAGMKAAHERSIVHRDIKPANILVSSAGQVRITDFGLAKLSDASRLTRTGTTMGTSAYCSPEQTRGEAVDQRTDIWAFGVVLYEMLVGRRPFVGEAEATVVYSVLMDDPKPPSMLRPEVPPALDRIVMRALSKDSGARYQQMDEVWRDLLAIAGSGTALTRPDRPAMLGGRVVTRKGRWVLGGVGAFFVAGLAWVVLRALPANVAATPEAVPTVRPGVVVLGLRPEAGGPEAAWLSAALTEGLGTTIAAHPNVRLVSPDVASRMQTELGLTSADTLDPDALGRIRLNTGADLVVAGAVQPALAGGRIRLSLDVFDARTGARHAAVADSAPAVELFDLTFRAGRALGAALDFGAWPADAEGAIQAALPAGFEAAQRYAEGLSRLRVLDARGAVASFERLLELQPDFALAQGALARAWSIMGYEPRAKAAAVRALAASEGLSRENRLLLEALHHDTHRDWNQAIEVYRVLFGFFPDQVDYGLRLLDAQASGDEAGAAQQTLERLRRLPPPASQDARIDLAEGRIAEAMSDFERERTAAARARLKASTQGASILLADAWYYEGWALWNLGKPAEAMAAYREAHTLFESAGLRVRAADMINAMGILQWDEGEYEDALRLLDEALTIKREAGQLANVANILNNISNVHKSRGELTAARRYMEEAIAVREETGQEGPLSANLANLANLMRDMGDLDGAKTQYLSSIVIARRVGRRHTEANALMNLAELYHTVGELAEARRAHESAIALSRAVDRPRDVAFSYWGLGRLAFSESDLDRAIALYDSSVAEYRRIEYDVEAEENRLWIVEVHLAAGRYPEAEALLEEVVPYLQRQEDTYGELFAQALRLRLYLAREDRRAGESAAERIRVLREDNEDFELDALAAIELARFEAAEGRAAKALATLEVVAEETGRRRYVSTHLEARLTMAEMERGLGRTAAAERRRAAVEAEARAYGFVRLADRATRGKAEP